MIVQKVKYLIHQLILMSRQMLIGQDQASAVEAAAIVYEVIIDGGEHVYVEVGEVYEGRVTRILSTAKGSVGAFIEILPGKEGLLHISKMAKERVEKAVISVGKKEIQDMIDEGKDIEVKCHFCNTAYKYTVDELKDVLKRCKR